MDSSTSVLVGSPNDNEYDILYKKIISSPGLLTGPESFKSWFPKNHGHKKISKLFIWGNQFAHSINSSIYQIKYRGKICALKQLSKSSEFNQMIFQTEAKALSKLSHEGIIGFVDIFFDHKYYYLILEKADYNLLDIIAMNDGSLSEDSCKSIIYSLLEVLQYLHSKNVVHRDLKPENICFFDSDIMKPKLIDFGDVCKAKKDKIYDEFVGTPQYMAPERHLGRSCKGWELKKSDMFAIGVITFEMYFGASCFNGYSQKEIFSNIKSENWSYPHNKQMDEPSDNMKNFIEICLMNATKDRPSVNDALNHSWFQ